MANNNIEKLTISFMKRNARQRGPTQSAAWNDQGEELAQDLTSVSSQWNNSLVPLLSTIPDGQNDLNAFANGLDGRTLLVDSSVTDSNSTYWNTGSSRPNSLKEQLDSLYTLVNNSIGDLEALITSSLPAASQIQIKDSNNLFDSTNVEDALQEVMGLAQSLNITSSDIDKLNQLNLSGANTFGSSIYFPDGTVSGPSIARANNHQTGIYFSGNTLKVSNNGVNSLSVDSTGLTVTSITTSGGDSLLGNTRIYNSGGSIEINVTGTGDRTSYIDFHSDDTNIDFGTRLIRDPGVNGNFELTMAGTGSFIVGSDLSVTGAIRAAPSAFGTSQPGYSFTGFSSSGIGFDSNQGFPFLGYANTPVLYWNTSFISTAVRMLNVDGTQSTPAYSFGSSSNTGIWRSGSGNLAFSVNNVIGLVVTPTSIGIGNLQGITATSTTLDLTCPLTQPISTPSSSTAAGTEGQIEWDTDFIYVCVATNTWKRVALSTF